MPRFRRSPTLPGPQTPARKLLAKGDALGALAAVDRVLVNPSWDGELEMALRDGVWAVVMGEIQGRTADAFDWTERLLPMPGVSNAWVLTMRGRIQMIAEDFDGAIDSFGQAIPLANPEKDLLPTCLHLRASLLILRDEGDAAIDDLRLAIDLPAVTPEERFHLIEDVITCAIRNDRRDLTDELVRWSEDALRIDPANPDGLDTRDGILVFTGRAAEAIDRIDQRVASGPTDPRVRTLMLTVQGRARFDLGDIEGALQSAQGAESSNVTGTELGAFHARLMADLAAAGALPRA